MSARRRYVYARLDAEVALVATTVDAGRARRLARTLRNQHSSGTKFSVSPRSRPVSTSWNRLRARLSREPDGKVITDSEVATDAEEDGVLAAGGKVRRLRWVSL
jgi:hypothetical protein